MQRSCGRRGRKYFGDATRPKDKDAQRLLQKNRGWIVATSGVKRTTGGHRFCRETGTRPIVRLTSGVDATEMTTSMSAFGEG